MEAVNMLGLAELLQAARRHILYEGWNFNETRAFGDAAWRRLPLLESEALAGHVARLLDQQHVPGFVYYTSGTTRKQPKALLFGERDIQRIATLCSRFARLEGITEHSRVMVLLPMSLWLVGRITVEGHRLAGAAVYPVDLHGGLDHWQAMANEIRPTVISSTPSVLHAWAPHYKGPPVELVETTGEPLTELERQHIERHFGAPVFDAYGLSECVVGSECQEHEGFHVWPDATGVEIVDPESGEVLPEGKVGEIVVTSFMQEAMPIIRYRTGDMGCLATSRCRCGISHPRLFLRGTRHRMIQLSRGVQTTTEEIRAALPDNVEADVRWKPVPGSPASTVLRDEYVPILEILLRRGTASPECLEAAVKEALPHLAELVHEGELHLSVVAG